MRSRSNSTFPARLVQTGAATAAAAAVGVLAADPDGAWYRSLVLPSWQPPRAAFPIVWTGLYAGLAVTSAAVLARHDMEAGSGSAKAQTHRSGFQRAFTANLVLNAGWSVVFWRVRNPRLASLEAAVLAASTIDLACRAAREDGRLGASLLPYAAWTVFAKVLTSAIARRNPDLRG
ncbi:tryptophan-rich sensory protein [Zafaria cholistanensis]|uniref:Tryptophan-rich sensory protein n=2 Tax=Zafaria cholistanensis TaxID=1682741 RepID=A0A5A7NUR2_9MICC|nr:tryptophan-rich sensory protein [Zafaria cholistanensis]